MMLHIGCGVSRIDEFVNIDCRETPTTDIVAPAWDLRTFGDGSVNYVYARHMLEHLSMRDAIRSLAEWRRVLCVGGFVHIVVPNLLYHARQLLGLVTSSCHEDQHEHALAGLYGWQADDEDVHRWGYTPTSLASLLRRSGFSLTDDGIEQLIELDRDAWHINMRATKGMLDASE